MLYLAKESVEGATVFLDGNVADDKVQSSWYYVRGHNLNRRASEPRMRLSVVNKG